MATKTFSQQLAELEAIKLDIKNALSEVYNMSNVKFSDYADIIRAMIASRAPLDNSAGAWNGVYQRKNLLSEFTLAQLSTKIAAGDFSGIPIGSYIEMAMSSTLGGSETVRWLVAGHDHFLHCGDTEISAHHTVLVPEDCFKTTAKMNSSNTTANAYVGSYMYTDVLPAYATAVANAFGSSRILSHKDLLSTAITATLDSMAGGGLVGASSSWAWQASRTIDLMSEPMVYGTMVCSSSLYDVGCGKSQLPLFALNPEMIQCGLGLNGGISARNHWWLRAVASSTYFAYVSSHGFAYYNGASVAFGVRPFILFK